jgi:hypothetical protein
MCNLSCSHNRLVVLKQENIKALFVCQLNIFAVFEGSYVDPLVMLRINTLESKSLDLIDHVEKWAVRLWSFWIKCQTDSNRIGRSDVPQLLRPDLNNEMVWSPNFFDRDGKMARFEDGVQTRWSRMEFGQDGRWSKLFDRAAKDPKRIGRSDVFKFLHLYHKVWTTDHLVRTPSSTILSELHPRPSCPNSILDHLVIWPLDQKVG